MRGGGRGMTQHTSALFVIFNSIENNCSVLHDILIPALSEKNYIGDPPAFLSCDLSAMHSDEC